ncbi:ABC transporter permease subunit [Candidatus Poriferisocius sp.]|uniref:ABC transporter permease subunit n=1 Tax=Candidatus Poriferisocius sp. TaxID=3101276 RepID=UPI003B5194E3
MTEARIHDRGYLSYDGPRHRTRHAMANLSYHTAQRVLGLKRSNWQKVLPAITLFIAFVPAIVFIGIAAFLPNGEDLGLASNADYYGFITGALFLFTAFIAPEAVCTDRRSGMLGLYLASPLSRDTYLLAKAAAIAAVLGTMTLGPPLLMLIAYTLADAGPSGVTGWLTELGRILASGAALSAFWTALSLALSSLTARRSLASVGIFVGLLASSAVGDGLAGGAEVGDSFALFNLIALPFEAVYRIFGEAGDGDGPPIDQVDTWAIFAALVGLIAAFGAFARWRYQRIEISG